MALPDLTRLAIGTHGAPCARTYWPESVFERLPFDLVKLIVYSKIDAPSQHPKDALEAYDQWCSATASDKAIPVIFGVTSCIYAQSRADCESDCRALLVHIFEAYGWTEWLKTYEVCGEATQKNRLRIASARTLDTASEPLEELRALAELHAACYVRDDEAKDVLLPGREGPVRAVVADRARKRDRFETNVEKLSFEYVTSKLLLQVPGDLTRYLYWPNFNGNLRRWNPRSLRDASDLFRDCYFFEGKGVDEWTMTALENANYMFFYCLKFDADLTLLNPVSLRSTEGMFLGCYKFKGHGLKKWAGDWAKKLSNAVGMFDECHRLDFSNLRDWELPNYELNATKMFCRTPISKEQAREMADLMKINTRWTEQNMAKIDSKVFEDELSPIYSSGDGTDPVASADKLDAKNPWHVAGVIFGQNEHYEYRGPHVMALLASAVEEWRKKYPA